MTNPLLSQNNRIPGIDLKDLLDRRKREAKSEINCMMPGTVVDFDPLTQTASVQISFLRKIDGGGVDELGQVVDKYLPYPILRKCPLIGMSGSGGGFSFPVNPGDNCMVMFCDRDIDGWWTTGQTAAPNSDRMHDLNDAFIMVGANPLTNVLEQYAVDGPTIFNGDVSVGVLEDGIKLAVGNTTLGQAIQAIISALLVAKQVDGTQFDAPTLALITTAQGLVSQVLK
jgi:hypothetical protein